MITAGRRRPGGYGHWFNGNAPDIERDSITCCHCNSVVFVEPLQPAEDVTGWCMRCMRFICLNCAAHGECVPFEKRLDQMERGVR
jgi:hypothetical protein